MAQEIRVPEVSEGVTEGTVISVAVAVGDKVEADQTLLELETDKAVVAIPSPFDGTITEIKVSEGDTVAVGAVIMTGEPDGGTTAAAAPAEEPVAEAPVAEEPAAAPAVETPAEPAPEPEPVAAPAEPAPAEAPTPPASTPEVDLTTVRQGDRVAPAAPSVRRLARDLGVDIYQVQGTGPGGRLSEEDVGVFVRETMQRITGGGPTPMVSAEFPGLHAQRPLPDFSKWGGVTQEPLSKVRSITADAMSYAWSTIPMVTQYDKTTSTILKPSARSSTARWTPTGS